MVENLNVLESIVFSEKCLLWLGGALNNQACRISCMLHLNTVSEITQSTQLLMIWRYISNSKVINPFFIDDGTVTGD